MSLPQAETYLDHGGDVYTRPVRLDFSSNTNPLGPPASALAALAEAASPALASAYPDARCRKLTVALAAHLGVDPAHILCTAGASDFIARLANAMRPRRALVTAPCFSGYERALAAVGTQVAHHVLRSEDDFALTPRVLDDITSDVDLVMLCSPNNPTGLTVELPLVKRILDAAREAGALVMLDETFLGFTDAPSARTLLAENPHLVIVDALTKLYALAGVRVGFGLCANTELLARIELAGPEWAVSAAAQMAGVAALKDAAYMHRTREEVAHARAELARNLRDLGFRVIDGEANYLLFRVPESVGAPDVPLAESAATASDTPANAGGAAADSAGGTTACDPTSSPAADPAACASEPTASPAAPALLEPLLDRGILVRPCARYHGLDETWYRVAVRMPDENRQLICALKEVIS